MTINKPDKIARTSKIVAEPVTPAAISDNASSPITTEAISKKAENKGIFSKIKSFFGMS